MNDDLTRHGEFQEETFGDFEEATTTEGGSEAVVGQAGATMVVNRPAPGQTIEIQAAAGQTYVLNFPPGEAQVLVQGDNFILTFDDNGDGTPDSRIVFLDLVTVADGAGAPTFQVAGVDIASGLLVDQALALAGEDGAPLDDVAAGPSLGSGATAYSDNLGEAIALLAAQGVIPPVNLQFGLIDIQNEILLVEGGVGLPLADPVLTPAQQGEVPPGLLAALDQLGFGGGPVLAAAGSGSALLAAAADDSVPVSQLEAFMGVADDTFSVLGGTEGSAIKITVEGAEGDSVSFDWNFLTDEATPTSFNDTAYLVVLQDGAVYMAVPLADTNSIFGGSSSVFNEETGYTSVAFSLPADGTYTIGVVVFDVGDTVVDSGLLVDNLQINGTTVGFESGTLAGWQSVGHAEVVDAGFEVLPTEGDFQGLITTAPEGGEGGGGFEIVFFKELIVDGDINDDDSGVVADFGGSDPETPLEDLVFTLQSEPAYGLLVLVTGGGVASFLTAGDTFTSADTVYWFATAEQIDEFLSGEGAPEFLPNVEFLYSVTDSDGNSADAPVTITLPPPNPPETALTIEQGDCLNEDTAGSLFFAAEPTDGSSKISQIVISGFPTGGEADAWVVDDESVNLLGLPPDTPFTASYDAVSGTLTISLVTANLFPGQSVQGTVVVTPNPDSDVDAPLTLTATAVNGAGSTNGSIETVIAVDADADGGEGAPGDDGDGIHLSVTAAVSDSTGEDPENGTFQAGETGTLNITATFDDFLDGSETHTIVVKAPEGFTILGIDGTLPAGMTLTDGEGPVWTFDVETLNGLGSVDFTLQVQNTGAGPGEAVFEVLAVAEETTTGDIECVDGGEGGIDPIAGDNVAFVETTATAVVAAGTPPEVALSLPDEVDCIAEDSATDDAANVVSLTVTPVGDDEIIEIVISGLQPDWSYDFSGLEISGATLTDSDYSDGSITITVANLTAYSGSFAVAPPADSDIDHPTITATATVEDPTDPSLTASGQATLDIAVDAVADAVTVDVIVNDGADANDTFQANETGTVRVVATFGDVDDESERHTVTVVVPAAFLIGSLDGLPDGVTVELGETGEVIFTVGSGVTSLDYTFEVTAPSTVSGGESFFFEATATADETNTQSTLPDDIECTELNNHAEDSDFDLVYGGVEEVTPFLIVGENDDDIDGSLVDHRVHFPSAADENGPIIGDDGADVLVGDVGGGALVNKTMNLALVLDTSNSMEAEIEFNGVTMMRIEALDLAVESLLDKLTETPGLTVRLRMVSFANDVKDVATFDIMTNGVVDATALQAAKDFILAAGDDPTAVAQGSTNYEAGFNSALEWFSDDANTLDDPDFNKTIFVSDGLPNRVYEGNSTTDVIVEGNTTHAIQHVLGTFDSPDPTKVDNISELAGLLGTFKGIAGTVDAIGINVGDSGVAVLSLVDQDDAISIVLGEELANALDGLAQVTQLAAVGNDVIEGGGAADLIFGDALYTDILADDEGVDMPPGSGWAVFESLIDDGFFDSDASKTVEEEIMDFLRNPANQAAYDFGRESTANDVGREGGDDTIAGGGGADLIFGQEGNDIIDGGDGADTIVGGTGNDSMTGGTGPDTFVWTDQFIAGEVDTVAGFEDGPGGDVLDLSSLLVGVDGGDGGAELDAYLEITSDGTDTTITVDADGNGSGTDVTIVCQGVDLTGGSANQADIIDSLLSDGTLVTA